ncbi:AfsR/SARP family transcriptional regulator [Nocardia iowensis]|uniref:AfsR/SARP family transcriptional regulator n=1 Tax=Nocardia iowensis TaxID=204891 RepID=A0ABX8RX13_NOCIO|nr:AfsR/SARP family transcriptional regulator [Nocardia iowensis]QXN92940.1 AfsR/SARP family transcriptional regulator [Nocardia iowensis]
MDTTEHTAFDSGGAMSDGLGMHREVALMCRVLGPIEVEVDGVPVELRGPRPRQLLAALSFAAGAPVSNDVLAEHLWGPAPLGQPGANVRVVVHRLRAALGPHAGRMLELDRCGYRFTLSPEHTDHGRFAELVGAGQHALLDGHAAAAVDTLRAGLALWRGQPWVELGDSPELRGARAKLTELRELAIEELQAARLADGDTAGAVAALREAVIQAPYRERRWELLVVGLFRSGRQADALAELRKVRALLIEEVGVEPGPALRELERRLLDHDPGLLLPDRSIRPATGRATATLVRGFRTYPAGRRAS